MAEAKKEELSDKELFERAVFCIRKSKKKADADNAKKLRIYAWFKQATVGDVKGSQPWAVQIEARAKWDAWKAVEGKSKEDAYKGYVKEMEGDWLNDECMKEYKKP